MTTLSPNAQAVKDAFDSKWAGTRHQALIAALRAVAKHLGESRAPGLEPEDLYGYIIDVEDLLCLVSELEAL